MKKKLVAILFAGLTASPAIAADNFTIDPTHTFPGFEINHLGFSTQRGRFNSTKGTVSLDSANKAGSVDITIDASSIDTGLAKLEEHLKGEDFFDVKKFPVITFKSKKVNFNGDKPASIEGDFTLHGVTKPLTLVVSSFNCGTHPMTKKNVCGTEVSSSIKRTEFGISKYAPSLGDEVRLVIQAEMIKD